MDDLRRTSFVDALGVKERIAATMGGGRAIGLCASSSACTNAPPHSPRTKPRHRCVVPHEAHMSFKPCGVAGESVLSVNATPTSNRRRDARYSHDHQKLSAAANGAGTTAASRDQPTDVPTITDALSAQKNNDDDNAGWPDAFRAPASVNSENASASSSRSSSPSPSPWNTNVGPALAPSVITASIGAYLFGYHSAVINAPLTAIATDLGFADGNWVKGAVVSVMVVGGIAGGLAIGPFADKKGRRAALGAITVPLMLGAGISAVSPNAFTMILGRLITGTVSPLHHAMHGVTTRSGCTVLSTSSTRRSMFAIFCFMYCPFASHAGVGVGASSQIVPLYLSEVSPSELRGTLNGVRRVAYVLGCLAAFKFAEPLEAVGGPGWWRPLFATSIVPAAVLAVFASLGVRLAQELSSV